jgi:hypothetical protein
MGGHFLKESATETQVGNKNTAVASSSTLSSPHHTLFNLESPPHLTQRVRLGIAKAHEYYSRVYFTPEYDKDSSIFRFLIVWF